MIVKIINEENQSVEINDEMYILVCIDSLLTEKGRRYHDLWLAFYPLFENINIPIWILTKDTCKENLYVKDLFHSNMRYGSDETLETFKRLKVYKEKEIFSKTHTIIYSYTFIIYKNQVIKTYKRMNEKAVIEAFLKVLDIKYQKFVKKLRKRFDII